MKLENKVAIITGAGRGIGRAIALAFAKEGANMVAASRTLSEIQGVAAEVEALGQRALPVRADVSRPEDVNELIKSALQEFGRVDILANVAGVQGPIGPLVENDIEHWLKTIHINLLGTFLCSKAALPIMMKQRQGKIINLSGGGSTSPRPYFTAYGTSKTAVVRLTEALSEEVKDFNIQVNAIAPGAVNTKMLDEVLAAGEAAGEKALSEAEHQLETGGTPPEKAAALAVFLASDDSDGLTGRLISAVWDDWPGMAKRIPEIIKSDLYTLRRVSEQD